MAGAHEAGKRAALQVLSDLRPQSMTSTEYQVLKSIWIDPKLKQPSNELRKQSYGLFRWTLCLPLTFMAVSYGACLLRDRWSGIFIPMHM